MNGIIRVEKNRNFTVINNTALHDERLSWKALGLLIYLLSKPDDWRTSSEQLTQVHSDGRDTVRSGLKELETLGYLQRTRTRGVGGRWVHETVIYETPRVPETPKESQFLETLKESQFSQSGKSGAGQPGAGQPGDGATASRPSGGGFSGDIPNTEILNTSSLSQARAQEENLQDSLEQKPSYEDYLSGALESKALSSSDEMPEQVNSSGGAPLPVDNSGDNPDVDVWDIKNPLDARNTGQFLLVAFGPNMLTTLLDDPTVRIGLNRREAWYAVPLEECRLLHHAARERAEDSGLSVLTELRKLLDATQTTVRRTPKRVCPAQPSRDGSARPARASPDPPNPEPERELEPFERVTFSPLGG